MAAVVSLLAAISRLQNGAQGSQQRSVLPNAQDCVQYHGCEWTEQYTCPGAAAPGTSGKWAADDGTLSFYCCCGEGAAAQHDQGHETQPHNPSKRVIVMYTDRELPCGQSNRELLRAYAERTNAVLRVATSRNDSAFAALPNGTLPDDGVGARFGKLWLAGQALREGAARVAVFDDTVLVNEHTLDVFALAEAAGEGSVVGSLEDSHLDQDACDAYGVASCDTDARMVNSGLVVFSQRHRVIFDDTGLSGVLTQQQLRQRPEQLWAPAGLSCHGGLCDQALLNAQLQKHAVPVFDLNRNNTDCGYKFGGPWRWRAWRDKQQKIFMERSTCRVTFGSTLRRFLVDHVLEEAAQGLCLAHVTRGADEDRDELLCGLPKMMRCEAG